MKSIISLETSESESSKTVVNSNSEFLFILLRQTSNPLLNKISNLFIII